MMGYIVSFFAGAFLGNLALLFFMGARHDRK